MTRVSPRTNFHSSKLIRCLVDLANVDTVEPGKAFAEKLGLWIHFSDAVTLSAVHNDSIANPPKMQARNQQEQPFAACTAVCTEFDRIQAILMNSVIKSCSSNLGKTHIELPTPTFELPLDLATAHVPYRRFYEAHQRDMELNVQPLRIKVREALAKASTGLRKLAELDATLEKILCERERLLLAKVPLLLKKRFEQLFKAHQQMLVDTQQADNPAGWTLAGGWLARFCNDMQMLLLAEVELRLQPTVGLIEALKQDTQ
jgi:hypothetical protein